MVRVETEETTTSRRKIGLSNTTTPILLLHFMTYKIIHGDRNGHITRDIFHCGAMISSVAKVVGL